MSTWIIAVAVFIGVAAIVISLSMLVREKPVSRMEDRLNLFTQSGSSKEAARQSVLSQPLDDENKAINQFFERFNLGLIFEQADTSLTVPKMAAISLALGALGIGVVVVARLNFAFAPIFAVCAGSLPMCWVLFRRKRRLKKFASQLPEAMEMLGRSLRSGQSLGFGLSMVAQEMGKPIADEFTRVFEEQNLGIPLEQSLKEMAERIPNLDLKFFVTAVILQRQTGGDLAEILDKIGELIRERFRIWGQVQALTGEGRLSGVVLLGLPFVLFLTVYKMNPDYVSVLFTDPMGTKMLAGAIIMQILGALVIRKIVNIQV